MKGDYSLSLDEFSKFVSSYPDNNLVPTAKYYLAECYFHADKFDSALLNYQNVLEKNPEIDIADNLQYSIAWSYYKKNEIDNARKNFAILIEKYPKSQYSPDSYYRLGEISYNKGDLQEAIDKFTKFTELVPNSPNASDAYYWIGWSYYQLKNCTKTIETFEKLKTNYPKNRYMRDIEYLMAECYYKENKLEESKKYYNKVLESKADTTYVPDSLFGLVYVYQKQNDENRVIELLQELVRRFPASKYAADSYLKLGDYYYKNQKYEQSIESLKRITSDTALYIQSATILDSTQSTLEKPVYKNVNRTNPQVIYAQLLIADAYLNLKDTKNAVREYRFFLEKFPDSEKNIKVLKALAWIYIQEKDYTSAIVAYNDLLSKNPPSNTIDEIHYNIGEAYYSLKNYDSAIFEYERIRGGEFADDALYGSAWSSLKKKDYKASIADFQDLVDKHPDSKYLAESLFRIGEIYYLLNQYDSAFYSYKKNIDKQPKNEYSDDAFYWMGWTGLKGNDFNKAIESYTQLIEKYPGSEFVEDASFRIAFSYMSMKNYDMAIKKYQEFLAKYPQGKLVEDAIYALSQCYHDKGDAKGGETELSDLLGKDFNPEVKIHIEYILGLSAFNREDYAKCVEYYENFLKKYPDNNRNKNVLFRLAQAYYNQKEYKKAIEKLMEYRQKFPGGEDFESAIYWTGLAYLQMKEPDKAREEWNNIINNPASKLIGDVEYQLGEILYAAGKFDEALNKYKQIIEKYPANIKAFNAAKYSIGWTYIQLKDNNTAIEKFNDIVVNHPDSEYWAFAFYKLVELYSEINKNDELILLYEKYSSKLTKDETYYNALYRISTGYNALKRYDDAIRTYEIIAASDREKLKSRALLAEGYIYVEQKKWFSAREKFEKITKNYPDEPEWEEAQYNLAITWIKENKWNEAIKSLEPLINKKGEYSDDAYLLSGISYYQTGDYSNSVNFLRKLMDDFSSSKFVAEAQFRIGESLLADKKNKEAIVEYLKMDILYKNSEYADDALLRLGEIYEMENNLPKAKETYKAFISNYPTSELMEDVKNKLKKLE
ncbi:tetratricopeptide repeat protein [Candidatus Desantisbacteria bacterium]|nr:tetratricopeptide repeat protein [Candidatus Desantisbacteria bacterium]